MQRSLSALCHPWLNIMLLQSLLSKTSNTFGDLTLGFCGMCRSQFFGTHSVGSLSSSPKTSTKRAATASLRTMHRARGASSRRFVRGKAGPAMLCSQKFGGIRAVAH